MRQILVCWIFVAWLCVSAIAAQANTDTAECFVRCVRGRLCEVQGGDNARLTVRASEVKRIARCATARLVEPLDGVALEGRVMTERGLESFSISGTNMMFSENAKHIFSRARCLGLSADCAESRDKARILVTAGKGVVQPSSLRIGSPCAIGLPCGPVLVNKTPVAFSLIQSRLDGQWHLAPQRGSGASRTIEVRQGRIELPAGALAPGVTYRYSLRDAAGTEIVAGEFEVLSARMQSDVEVELTRIKSFPDGANLFDILDVLLNNDLWWDAMVRMR